MSTYPQCMIFGLYNWYIILFPTGAYTSHLFKLTLEFGAHDEVPESFEQFTTVDFTMPSCTVSKSQVRSISVENPTPPEKWVKYLAKYHYRIEIDHRDERAQSAKMATKESPASDSEWQLTDNELTVFDSIWQVVYWWCLLIVYLIFWKLWDWMLLLIVGPKASQWFLLLYRFFSVDL